MLSYVEVQRVVIWAKGERTDNGVSCNRESKSDQFLATFEILPDIFELT